MFKAVILRTEWMATGQSTKYNKNCSYPFNTTILCLKKKTKPLLIKWPFHNRLESTENAFNRNQSKNNAEETETHMFPYEHYKKRAFSATALSFCIIYIAWAGQMTREFHSAAAAVWKTSLPGWSSCTFWTPPSLSSEASKSQNFDSLSKLSFPLLKGSNLAKVHYNEKPLISRGNPVFLWCVRPS